MLFRTFSSQDERRKFGGSCFIELQYCRFPQNTAIKRIVSTECIVDWQNDSLYVYGDDQNLFYEEYSPIFDGGIYNNLQSGTMDLWGINYYRPEMLVGIIEKLNVMMPTDYQVLVRWLDTAKKYNGFYILGV